MKSFLLKVGPVAGTIVLIALYGFFKGWFDSSLENTPLSELSNSVQLGEESAWLVLSTNFARQLEAFGFEFGDFEAVPDFLNFLSIESAGDTAKIEILRDGAPFLTVFELQLPLGISYDDLIASLQNSIPSGSLEPAAFGSNSFYFLQNGLAINILPLGEKVLAFQFAPQNFEAVRDFITSLLVLR